MNHFNYEFIRIVADYYFNRSNAKVQRVTYIFNVQLWVEWSFAAKV